MEMLVNVEILRNPVNWLIIFVMLVFGAFCCYTVFNASKYGVGTLAQ